MSYAETALIYKNMACSVIVREKTKMMRVPVPPRLYLTKAGGTHLQTAQLSIYNQN
ncbi:hypothetical protein [Microcoleus sp. B9-D4]|uniref:hypothetical protein n=1 Tax=Microcoleus sp. B9-D4 TaxID=2818711 RepID=UPI002FD49A9A